MQYAAAAAWRGSYDSAGVGGHASGVVTTEQMNNLVTNLINMISHRYMVFRNKKYTIEDKLTQN